MIRFNIKINGEEKGPYTLEQIRMGIQAEAYPEDILVRPAKGGGEFLPLSEWLDEEESEAAGMKSPGSGSTSSSSSGSGPQKPGKMKLPAGKVATTPGKTSPALATGKKPVKKKSLRERLILFVASILFAAIGLGIFFLLWQRTGIDLVLLDDDLTVLWEGEEVDGDFFPLRQLQPGDYQLEIQGDAFHLPIEETITITFGRLIQREIALERGTGSLRITSNRMGARYSLVDSAGEIASEGTVPVLLRDIPAGLYELTFHLSGWPDQSHQVEVLPARAAALRDDDGSEQATTTATTVDFDDAIDAIEVREDFIGADLAVVTRPAGATYEIRMVEGDDEVHTGTTPGGVEGLRPGDYTISFDLPGWDPVTLQRTLQDARGVTIEHEFPHGSLLVRTEPRFARVYWQSEFIGRTPLEINDIPHGSVSVRVSFPGEGHIDLEANLRSSELIIGARFVDGEWERIDASALNGLSVE